MRKSKQEAAVTRQRIIMAAAAAFRKNGIAGTGLSGFVTKFRDSETMKFLRSHGLYYTSIDAPEDNPIVPSFIEATGDQVYVRFHGKNRENWFKRNITPAERFKYLYAERELQSLAKGFGSLEQQGVKRAYAIFNNCYQNFGIMHAMTMAAILRGQEQ